jgi:hypothetical protein
MGMPPGRRAPGACRRACRRGRVRRLTTGTKPSISVRPQGPDGWHGHPLGECPWGDARVLRRGRGARSTRRRAPLLGPCAVLVGSDQKGRYWCTGALRGAVPAWPAPSTDRATWRNSSFFSCPREQSPVIERHITQGRGAQVILARQLQDNIRALRVSPKGKAGRREAVPRRPEDPAAICRTLGESACALARRKWRNWAEEQDV